MSGCFVAPINPEERSSTLCGKLRLTHIVNISLVFCGTLSCPKQLTTEHYADPHTIIQMIVAFDIALSSS